MVGADLFGADLQFFCQLGCPAFVKTGGCFLSA